MSLQFSNVCITMFKEPAIIKEKFEKDVDYMVYQKEICPTTKKEHWQGYVELSRKLSLHSIKKLFNDPTMHIERRKGSQEQAINYCMKTESRASGSEPVEFGVRRVKEQGRRYDLENLFEYLMEGHTEKETYLEWKGAAMKYGNLITKTNQVLFGSTSKTDEKILRLRHMYEQMGEPLRSYAEVCPTYEPPRDHGDNWILGCGPSLGAKAESTQYSNDTRSHSSYESIDE